ncbi:gamma-butyrobetaine dioxygenase [Pyrenophora seminiperda CCB06]|uniref:Gamma-butyrobetaine dioxygenase n=1 Tax=Pyrenophora seminiperda CCB06 TaxID=1302712 RepID=A0A3M7LWP1_9PLEO|nr:gamma-butyrobetaine dioxygenase [Pyrenophora seminiperda CCB06]
MSSTIRAKYPLRMLAARRALTCRTTTVERPRFARNPSRPSSKLAEHADWSSAVQGPFRPTRRQQQQHQPEQELRPPQELDILIEHAPSVAQVHGGAARSIAVNIDGDIKVFDTVFLRDSCTCPKCVDPHSKNKLFQTSDIPDSLEGSARAIVDEEKGDSIELEWLTDVKGYATEHRTRHSIDWLRRAYTTEIELRGGSRHDDRVFWNKKKIIQDNKWLDYDAYMADDSTLFDALTHLDKYGLLFIKNVPESEESVISLASRIGTLKDTFYGRTWDVRSKPKAENIAYTPDYLGLHMDLLYTANPPHLQLLHSLRARTPGGESFFSDAFAAAHQLRRQSEGHFRTLCTFPVTYHYHHPEYHYHMTRPVIETFPSLRYEATDSAIRRINWSPPFQAPFEARIGSENSTSLRSFIAASHAYEKLLNSEENVYEYRLNEGECVIFDNRRVLHARRAFDATKGERWLKGAYVDDDVFYSKLRILEEKFEGKWVAEGVVRHAVK